MILVPFEDKITYDDDGSCTYSAWYSEFRLKGYYNWAPGQLIPSKPFKVFDLEISLAFVVYPSGNETENNNKDYVSVYLHNCNEEPVYVHATLDFLDVKHDINHFLAPGAVGFGSPGIVIDWEGARSSEEEFFDGLSCKFHLITKNEGVWTKYNEREWDEGFVEKVSNMENLKRDEKITLLVKWLKISEQKVRMHESILQILEETLRKEFPNCKAYPYGSTSSGFAFEDCDLDVFIDLGLLDEGFEYSRGDQQYRTKVIANILRREERFRSASPIVNARTPVVKLTDSQTGILCDINPSSKMGVKNSEFLKFCRLYDPRVDELVSFVKYFAIKHKIIGRGPGDHLNSYTIALMVIFFLQRRNILPPVEALQKRRPEELYRGWNIGFNKEFKMNRRNNSNVAELLVAFFEYYIHFPYTKHVICPLTGKQISKNSIKQNYELPDVILKSRTFEMKKDMLDLGKILVVQDPFELSKNVASSVSESSLCKYSIPLLHN